MQLPKKKARLFYLGKEPGRATCALHHCQQSRLKITRYLLLNYLQQQSIQKFHPEFNLITKMETPIIRKIPNSIQLNSTQFNSIQLNSTQFNSIQFNSSQVNSIQFNSIQFNSTQSNSIQFNSIQFNSTQLNSIQFLMV